MADTPPSAVREALGTAATDAGMRGRFWDDFAVGQVFEASGRTVTEAEVSAFSSLSGNFDPLHADAEFAAGSEFGERIPHGPIGLLHAIGANGRLGLVEGTAVAFLGLAWRFLAPVLTGDTLYARFTVASMRETRSADRGILVFEVEVRNQRDEPVQEGEETFMLLRRGASAG